MKKVVLLLLVFSLLLLTLDPLISPVFADADTSFYVTVPDVYGQFMALKHHGEALGFDLNGAPDPSLLYHCQGIQRLPNPGTPYFFVSRSGGDHPGNVYVVKMESRDEPLMFAGERLRSNRLSWGKKTEDTPPPAIDRVVHTIRFNGQNGWPNYAHAGGLQMVGDILVVPLESPRDGGAEGMIALVDVANPESPSYLWGMELTTGWGCGVVSITRMLDDRFVMLVTGGKNEEIFIYESTVTDLRNPYLNFVKQQRIWVADLLIGGEWPTGWSLDPADCHQSLNFVRQSDGQLFLIGTRNTQPPGLGGDDKADLYRVDYLSPGVPWMDTGELTLSLVASKHFWCDSDGAGRIGNFRASAGVYVSPSGELILYTTEHDNDGPSDSVRMGEFRHVYTTRPWSPLRCPTADAGGPYVVAEGSSIELSGIRSTPPPEKPWCELYDDKDYSDRSLILDWMDRSRDNFNNFDEHDGFTDKASSVIWQAPVGCDIILYEHDNYEGAALRLAGTGEVRAVPNLDWSDYKFNDKASSIRFDDWEGTGEATAMTFIWDLDGDYNYETPGREVLFSAALIDGPKNCIVRLAVDGAYFPLNDVAETTVEVYNIPPTATIDSMIQPNPHFILPIVHTLTFTGSFTDPGVKDTHTASWDFGDGTVASGTLIEENIAPDSTGAATANHVYSNPGTYTVTLKVTDDDGGFGTDTMQVKVLSAQEAKDLIHQYIQNLEDSAFKGDPTQRKKACVHALKKALSIMFAAIGDMLENEEWNRAIMITDLIRNIADGFVDGTPNNDWIVDPMAQKEICMMIDDLVAYLETFL